MATITAAKAGNWSDTSVWNGGVVPGNGDTADLNNYAITMDITRVPASGSLLGITDASATGTGYLGIALNTLGSSEIYVNYSGATGIVATKNTTGLIQVTGTTTNTLKITGNLTAGSANTSSAVYHNSTGALTINGDISASGGIANALYVLTAATVSITGNIAGGTNSSSRGARFDAASIVTINGNITAGSGSSAMGVYNANTGSVAVTGNITGGTGTSQAHGLYNSVGGAITLASCNLINGTGSVAYAGRTPTWTNNGSNYLQWAITEGTVKFGREPAAGKLYTDIVCGDVTGTLTVPAVAKVISDTSYGAGGTEYTGTYHEAAAAEVLDSVMFGAASAVAGTYHEAAAAEVQKDVTFGPASAYTGTYDPAAAAVYPDAADVWHDTGAYGPTGADYTPAMVGSDIANCAAGNIAKDVVIDDVTGTRVDCPVAKALTTSGNYGDPASPLVGTYVGPADADVRFGTANGVSPGAGTCYVPAAADVQDGVNVDDTTGTFTAPAATNVHTGVSYGGGGTEYTGTLTHPAVADVQDGVQYGAGGTELTGTFTAPAAGDVQSGVQYGGGGTEYTGTFAVPAVAKVLSDTSYGSSGTEYTGTYHEATAGEVKSGTAFGPASGYTGTYDPTADDVWPAEANVWYGTGAYGPTGADYTPAMRASDIANCTASNVKSGVVIDDVTGTYAGGAGGTYPSEDDVRNGEEYGPGGTDYTGNLTLPAVTDVQSGVTYGTSGTEYTGTFTSPSTAYVKKGVQWGAGGTEYTGTYELVVSGTSDGGTVFSGIRALLLADADVTVYGIYAGQAPENAKLPYIVLNYVDAIHEHHMAASAGKVNTRLQLDLYGTSWDQVYALAEECRLCLDSYRGSVAVGDDSIRFNQIYLSADNTSLLQEVNAAGLGYFRASQDYSIWTAETVPTH